MDDSKSGRRKRGMVRIMRITGSEGYQLSQKSESGQSIWEKYTSQKKNQTSQDSSSSIKSSAYSKMSSLCSTTQKAAATLREHIKNLAATGEGSLFQTAIDDKDNTEVVEEVKGFAQEYNKLLSNVKSAGGKDNIYAARDLRKYTNTNRRDLAKIGVSIGRDGMMEVDESKLFAADPEAIQKAFTANEFLDRLSGKSKGIEVNIGESMDSLTAIFTSNYNNSGSYTNSLYR